MALWEKILEGLSRLKVSKRNLALEDDPDRLRRKIDWILKLWLLNRYGNMDDSAVNDRWLKLLDFKYHDLDPATGLYAQCEALGFVNRMVDGDTICRAQIHPPENTRARIRGAVIHSTLDKNIEVQIEDWEKINVRAKRRQPGIAHPFKNQKGIVNHLGIRLDDPFKALDSTILEKIERFVDVWGYTI